MDFTSRLRMDNLYPTSPPDTSYPLFDEFMNRVVNNQGGRMPSGGGNQLQNIASQALGPFPAPEFRQTGQNTVYQPSVGDIARERAYGRDVYDIDPDVNAGYRQGQLALREQEILQKGEQNKATNELNKGKLANAQDRTRIYEFKSKNPGSKFQINKASGDLEAINPVTNQVTNLGHYEMPQDELIALNQQNKLEGIHATGEETRTTQAQGQTGKETLAETAARHAKELEDIKAKHAQELEAAKIAGKGVSPNEQRIAATNRAQLAMDTHPEWAKYIVKTPGGGYYIKPTGIMNGVFSGPTEEVRKQISDFINSNETGVTKPTGTTTKETNKDEFGTDENPQKGHVKVFPNGRKGKWDGQGYVAIGGGPVKK